MSLISSMSNGNSELSWLLAEDQVGLPMDLCTAAAVGAYDVIDAVVQTSSRAALSLISAPNRGGWTPLMYAAYVGHDAVVTLLGECGADVNAANSRGQSALMLAASCGNEASCLVLLKYGANLEAVDHQGWSALFYAVYLGHHNVVRLLLGMGACCQSRDAVCRRSPLMQAAAQGHDLIVRLLLDQIVAKADDEGGGLSAALAAVDASGLNALNLSRKSGHAKVVELLAAFTTSPSTASVQPGTPVRKIVDQKLDEMSVPSMRVSNALQEGPQRIEMLLMQQQQQPSQDQQAEVSKPQSQQTLSPTHNSNNGAAVQLPNSLAEALGQLGLSKYVSVFEQQDIDLTVFLSLNDEDLKEIGVTLLGPRRKITSYLGRLRANNGNQSGDGVLNIRPSVLQQGLQSGFVTQLQELRSQNLAERKRSLRLESYLSGQRALLNAAFNQYVGNIDEIGGAVERALEAHKQLGREMMALMALISRFSPAGGDGVDSFRVSDEEQARKRCQIWLHKVEHHIRHAKQLTAGTKMQLTDQSNSVQQGALSQ